MPSGLKLAAWSNAGDSVSRVALPPSGSFTRNNSPCTATTAASSSGLSANSVASRVKVTLFSVFDLSSAFTSMASFRGVEPSRVPTTHRSAPHSYTIHSPLALTRARRTVSSSWVVSRR